MNDNQDKDGDSEPSSQDYILAPDKQQVQALSKHGKEEGVSLVVAFENYIGPPMITVLKKKISFDRIIGPSVFKLLSIHVCVSVRRLYATALITQTCRSIFRSTS